MVYGEVNVKHYLLIDNHNEHKAHHISITDEGDIFYNQALCHKYHEHSKRAVPGHPGWYDFYEDEPVKHGRHGHGYQQYINIAYRKWTEEQPLDIGDTFSDWFNQGEREVEVIAVTGDEALAYYEMPKGSRFLAVYDRATKKWKGSRSVKSLTKKWITALTESDYLEFVQTEIGYARNW